MWPTVVILVALSSMATGCCAGLLLRTSRMSRPSSPPPSTSPTPISDEVWISTMRTMMEMMGSSQRETRELVTALVLGREPPRQTSERATDETPSESSLTWDYDQTPLAPGIEMVLEREAKEEELRAGMRERAGLQQRLSQLQEEWMASQTAETLSPGPWQSPSSSPDVQPAGDFESPS